MGAKTYNFVSELGSICFIFYPDFFMRGPGKAVQGSYRRLKVLILCGGSAEYFFILVKLSLKVLKIPI